MIRRLGGPLVVFLALVAVGLFARLSLRPIALPFLRRPVAAAVEGVVPGLTASVDGVELARVGRGVAMRVSGLRVARPDGSVIVSVPSLAIRPSLRELVQGRFEVAAVWLDDARLALVRSAEGAWALAAGDGGEGAALLDLFGAPAPAGEGAVPVARHVPRLVLHRLDVSVDDRLSGVKATVADGELVVDPHDNEVETTGHAALTVTSAAAPVRGKLVMPLEAHAIVAGGIVGGLGDATFTIAGGEGLVQLAGDAGAPFALADVRLDGRYTAATATLEVTRGRLAVGPAATSGTATVRFGDAPSLALAGSVDALAVTDLVRLWPEDLAAPARRWVDSNVSGGTLRSCRLNVGTPGAAGGGGASTGGPASGGALPPIDGAALPTGAPAAIGGASSAPSGTAAPSLPVDVRCEFDGVAAAYLRPLAPLQNGRGSARLTADRLEVTLAGGDVGACRVDGATLAMDLAPDPPRATIAADVSGATADVLALVDAPPLAVASGLGIAPADVGGTARVHADLALPIAAHLDPAAVKVVATAALADASLANLAAGVGIRDGTLDVRLDGGRVDVRGRTGVTGVPQLDGPVDLQLAVAPGEAAGERRVDLAVDGEGVLARGSAVLAGGAIATADVRRLRLGRHDLSGTWQRGPAGDARATLTGSTLDVASLRADPSVAAAAASTGGAWQAPLALEVRLAHVRVSPELELRNLRGSVRAAGGALASLSLAGSTSSGGDFQASLDGHGTVRRVSLASTDAGRLLTGAGLPERIVGGNLKLDSTTDVRGPLAFLEGEIVLRDFKVVKAPVMAKILGVGSFAGMAALVQGEGMPMKEARLPFRWEHDVLDLNGARAVGPIGIDADGTVDSRAGTCDLRGQVIPLYTANTALAKIPLVGRLAGGKDQGLFAVAYQVNGPLGDPRVQVNTLGSVTPSVVHTWLVDPFSKVSKKLTGREAPARGSR